VKTPENEKRKDEFCRIRDALGRTDTLNDMKPQDKRNLREDLRWMEDEAAAWNLPSPTRGAGERTCQSIVDRKHSCGYTAPQVFKEHLESFQNSSKPLLLVTFMGERWWNTMYFYPPSWITVVDVVHLPAYRVMVFKKEWFEDNTRTRRMSRLSKADYVNALRTDPLSLMESWERFVAAQEPTRIDQARTEIYHSETLARMAVELFYAVKEFGMLNSELFDEYARVEVDRNSYNHQMKRYLDEETGFPKSADMSEKVIRRRVAVESCANFCNYHRR
jgi:hypothetical protein